MKNYCKCGGREDYFCFAQLQGVNEEECEFFEEVEGFSYCAGHVHEREDDLLAAGGDCTAYALDECHSEIAMAEWRLLVAIKEL